MSSIIKIEKYITSSSNSLMLVYLFIAILDKGPYRAIWTWPTNGKGCHFRAVSSKTKISDFQINA